MPDGVLRAIGGSGRLQVLKIFRKPNILKNLVFWAKISLKLMELVGKSI
jgi:hypothetical protein